MNIAAFMAALRGDMENAIIASTPGGIEAQEAAGQRAFVADQTLPRERLPRKEVVQDDGVTVWQTEPIPTGRYPGKDGYDISESELARNLAWAWLAEHYPQHQDPLAYWN